MEHVDQLVILVIAKWYEKITSIDWWKLTYHLDKLVDRSGLVLITSTANLAVNWIYENESVSEIIEKCLKVLILLVNDKLVSDALSIGFA